MFCFFELNEAKINVFFVSSETFLILILLKSFSNFFLIIFFSTSFKIAFEKSTESIAVMKSLFSQLSLQFSNISKDFLNILSIFS